MIDRSFQILRTNPRLTTNIKLVVTSEDKIFLESFNTNKQLSDQKYKHYQLDKESTYEYSLTDFYRGMPSQLAFDVKYENDNQLVFTTYDKQFDDMYWAGAKRIEDKWYQENFEYFAPLYLNKNKLPDGFVILRVDDPIPYEEVDNRYIATELKRDNFFNQVVDKWKCVSLIDLRYQTNIGYYLINNIIDNQRFPVTPFELDFREYEFSKWYGIDYNAGVYAVKSKYLKSVLELEQPHFKLEKEITNGYRDNNLVFPNIWNMKFLFNDKPATPDNFRDYSINRYYGFYVDDLEFVTNLTSYITPTIKSGVSLINNIFISGGTELIETPFLEEFDVTKDYFIYWNNKFYEVTKVYENSKYVYKVIADEDLSDIDFSQVNDRVCFISYQEGNYRCLSYDNPSGYTNYVRGYTSNFAVDPYEYVIDPNTDPPNYETRDMFGDLYLIKIDGVYHILKKRGEDYFIQSDYAINSYPTYFEYWKGGRNSDNAVQKAVNIYGQKPEVYSVYRIKFSDIRDFDFDRVDTKFADFDYEKDSYYVTSEQKLYAVEYSDLSIDKQYKVHPRGEEGQYMIMNISSEYIADDELYEIKNNDLTEIWRKNQYINKWGVLGSNSHADYPYKMNNSVFVGDVFNRTTDVFSLIPNEPSKNLDYFYRVGNLYSGSTIFRYLNQSVHLETDLMEQIVAEKFDLDIYYTSNVDYFDYFFKNKMYYELNGQIYQKPTLKYAVFDGGDNYTRSSTVFKGLQFNVLGLEDVTRDDDDKINTLINNRNTYNGYKFSVLLNDVYMRYSSIDDYNAEFRGKEANGLQNNNIFNDEVNGIHIFLNDKFKNILCVINCVINIESGSTYSFIDFNNFPVFGEKYGLYKGTTLNNRSIMSTQVPGPGSIQNPNYNSVLLTAANFIASINDMSELYGFDSGVTYYYINSDGLTGSTGPMNNYITGNTMSQIDEWYKEFPPYVLTISYPEEIYTKRKSYNKEAIKGPATNIYNRYNTYFNSRARQNLEITEPLARQMSINQQQDTYRTVRFNETISYKNLVYRYSGRYEPVFKTIPVFQPAYIYNGMNSGYTDDEYKYFKNNQKFDYELARFGLIDELVYSKVNPTVNPLKLKNTTVDKSIYPMVDEFGYQFSSRFIFSSAWDRNFYVITRPDQVTVTKKIALSSVSVSNTNVALD